MGGASSGVDAVRWAGVVWQGGHRLMGRAPSGAAALVMTCLFVLMQILVGFAGLEGILSRETDEDLHEDDGFRWVRATVAG